MPKKTVHPRVAARAAAPTLPTVAEYFQQRLGADLEPGTERDRSHPASPYHPDFHIDTGCGADCRAAIDAAAEILKHVYSAFGDPSVPDSELPDGVHPGIHPDSVRHRDAIIEATRDTVLCFVYG